MRNTRLVRKHLAAELGASSEKPARLSSPRPIGRWREHTVVEKEVQSQVALRQIAPAPPSAGGRWAETIEAALRDGYAPEHVVFEPEEQVSAINLSISIDTGLVRSRYLDPVDDAIAAHQNKG